MSFHPNTVDSVQGDGPVLVILLPSAQVGWCKQFSQEGYNVAHIEYPNASVELLQQAVKSLLKPHSPWALITYGLQHSDTNFVQQLVASETLKACIHFCPITETKDDLVYKAQDGTYISTLVHLTSTQETLHASLVPLTDPVALGYPLPLSSFPPVSVHIYPLVPQSPPFPFHLKPPALVTEGETSSSDPYIRSASGLSYTRTLALLRRELGPHFDLEKLWERHTYYEFVERDALKTMSTMVATPYVNHVATMTGGMGFNDLARFYRYHFTKENVTPPDTELITVSRTVGADRVIDEMIFKCTHTTEIDYFLPGIKPTGKALELAMVGVVAFRGDKLTFEHLYWDQASALVQLGLLDPTNLPVAGVETARKVIDPFAVPSNTLLAKWKESEGLPLD